MKTKGVKNFKDHIVFKMLAIALVPFLVCLFYCLVRGESLFKVYVPNTVNNDCLFYYKLVDGVVHGWMPKGYFGYNESHALYGSYGAWNPVIILYWALWGRLFGWNFNAVVISNIVIFSVALAVFVWLTKAKWSGILSFFVLMLLFPAVPVHILNALAETVIGSLIIIFFALAIREGRIRKSNVNIAFMLIISFVLTLIRPYMILLFFLPWFFMSKKNKLNAWMITLALAVVSFVGYFVMGKYLTSEYIYPVYNLSAVHKLFAGDFKGCLSDVKYAVIYTGSEVLQLVKNAFLFGMTVGTQYFIALLTSIILILWAIFSKAKGTKVTMLFQSIFVFLLLAAVIIIYQTGNDGGRHFYVLAVTGCLLMCNEIEGNFKYISIGCATVFLLIFAFKGSYHPTDYDAPFENKELKAQIEYWESTFDEKNIRVSKEIGYDNTVAWVLTDNVSDEYVVTDFNELFGLPEGMGINCCEYSYVVNNFSSMKSKFIACAVGGDVDKLCKEAGFSEVGRTSKLVIYQR